MEFLILIVGIAAIGGIIYLVSYLRAQEKLLNALANLKNFEAEISRAIVEFENYLKGERYFNNKKYLDWKNSCAQFAHLLNPRFVEIKSESVFKDTALKLAHYYENGRDIIDQYNRNFSRQETEVLKTILEKRRIPGNTEQLAAAVSEEDSTLVVAGAGTGKTTAIVGKLAYLVDRLKVDPSEVLLLSFTTKAAGELTERMKEAFPEKDIKGSTFHSFGLSIIGKATSKKPDIAFSKDSEREQFIDDKFENLLLNSDYMRKVVHYFAFHLNTEETEPQFETLDEYYRHVKTEEILTLQKELVKSQQEAMIANFLYLNGIKYKYEERYKFDTATEEFRQYKPDFYLIDYDLYLEHFGIDRQGEVHFVKSAVKNRELSHKYQKDMEWKRNLHREHNTKLLETYSYEFSERNWEEMLTAKLKGENVEFKPRSTEEMLISLREGGEVFKMSQLFLTFLDLAKSNHYSRKQLEEIVANRGNLREEAFLELFLPIYDQYENYLRDAGTIDFHDMLNQSTEFILSGKCVAPYSYIIIDEFQDFSVSKNKLIRAVCNQNPEAKLFCVGDDWQAIYRFAGADVGLMTDFDSYHGFTNHLKLVTTNRFDTKLAKISGDFVMKNPQQIKKQISAARTFNEEPVEVVVKQGKDDPILGGILASLNRKAINEGKKLGILLLGRYSFNKPKNLDDLKRDNPWLAIEFLTIHKSKGLGEDYVIVLDVINDRYGFPSGITDDPVLELVLSRKEDFPHAEERRLMYVALTRTKNKVYVVTAKGRVSLFASELDKNLRQEKGERTCRECQGIMVKREGPFGEFWGCNNFPDCQHTERIEGYRRPGSFVKA